MKNMDAAPFPTPSVVLIMSTAARKATVVPSLTELASSQTLDMYSSLGLLEDSRIQITYEKTSEETSTGDLNVHAGARVVVRYLRL